MESQQHVLLACEGAEARSMQGPRQSDYLDLLKPLHTCSPLTSG